MSELFDRITAMDNLRTAWERVAQNRGAPGIDQVSVARFARNWEENLYHLRDSVRASLPRDMGFERRARRPPADPITALLGQGVAAALESVGLDPYDGFYHAERYGRPALALDLMEEFRGPIVDSIVRTMLNKRLVGRQGFSPGPRGALYCSPRGQHQFFRQYSAQLQAPVKHPLYGRTLTYQKCFEVQARVLVHALKGEVQDYVPFITR